MQYRRNDVTYQRYYDGNRICAFDWCQNQWPWMTLNGRNITLAEIKKNYGAQQKNFNKGRPTVSAAKCGLMTLVSRIRNIRYMRIVAGVIHHRGASSKIRLGLQWNRSFIMLNIIGLHAQRRTMYNVSILNLNCRWCLYADNVSQMWL